MGHVGLLGPSWGVRKRLWGRVGATCHERAVLAMLGQHVGKVERPQNTAKYRVFRNRHIGRGPFLPFRGRFLGPWPSPWLVKIIAKWQAYTIGFTTPVALYEQLGSLTDITWALGGPLSLLQENHALELFIKLPGTIYKNKWKYAINGIAMVITPISWHCSRTAAPSFTSSTARSMRFSRFLMQTWRSREKSW